MADMYVLSPSLHLCVPQCQDGSPPELPEARAPSSLASQIQAAIAAVLPALPVKGARDLETRVEPRTAQYAHQRWTKAKNF